MKQTTQHQASREPKAAEPVRPRPAPAHAAAATGHLAQLAGMLNNNPLAGSLAQLRDDIQNSPRMRRREQQSEAMNAAQASAIVQAKLTNPFAKWSKLEDPGIIEILKEVEIYNSIGGYRFTFPIEERKPALTQLGKIERMIYAWFDLHKSHDLDMNNANINMKVLMNDVARERQALVELSISNKDEDPPVANFDKLPGELKKEIAVLWRMLLAGKGIQIEGPKEFKLKVLSDFSRLLETEMGRTLVGGIIETGQGLVVTPTEMGKGKFVARPVDAEKEGLEETEEHDNFVPVDVRNLDESQRLRLLQQVRSENPKSPGVSVRSEKGIRHFRFGKGTGSTLPVPIDSKDAMEHPSSRMADRQGNEVIAPTFINLGHELGHVLRSAQGISASGEGGRTLLSHSFKDPEFSRPEEFFNIGGVENRLRLESGMSERHGHGNLYSYWAVEGMNTIEETMSQIGEQLKHVEPDSGEEARLKGLQKRLLELQEPFQELMAGKGKIEPLLARLRQIKMEQYFS